MLVSELINILENYDPESEIMISHPSNDYWGRQLASEICDHNIDERYVKYSSYHNQKIIEDDDSQDCECVVVINIKE